MTLTGAETLETGIDPSSAGSAERAIINTHTMPAAEINAKHRPNTMKARQIRKRVRVAATGDTRYEVKRSPIVGRDLANNKPRLFG